MDITTKLQVFETMVLVLGLGVALLASAVAAMFPVIKASNELKLAMGKLKRQVATLEETIYGPAQDEPDPYIVQVTKGGEVIGEVHTETIPDCFFPDETQLANAAAQDYQELKEPIDVVGLAAKTLSKNGS